MDNVLNNNEETESVRHDQKEIKEEPSDQDTVATSYNIYDSLFEVAKYEPCDDRKQQWVAGSLSMDCVPILVTSQTERLAANTVLTKQETPEEAETMEEDENDIDSDSFIRKLPSLGANDTFAIRKHPSDDRHSLLEFIKANANLLSFVCKFCKKTFRSKSRLNTHLKTHTGVKPYVCEICSYKCAEKYYLAKHVMRTHSNEKRFACQLCPYKCCTKTTLSIHMRTHTGKKPFKCKYCPYECTHKISLMNHMKQHSTSITERLDTNALLTKRDAINQTKTVEIDISETGSVSKGQTSIKHELPFSKIDESSALKTMRLCRGVTAALVAVERVTNTVLKKQETIRQAKTFEIDITKTDTVSEDVPIKTEIKHEFPILETNKSSELILHTNMVLPKRKAISQNSAEMLEVDITETNTVSSGFDFQTGIKHELSSPETDEFSTLNPHTNTVLIKQEVIEHAETVMFSETDTDFKGFHNQIAFKHKLITSKNYKRSLRNNKKADVSERSFICTICQSTLPSRYEYKNHVRAHKSCKQPYSCEKCSYKCSARRSLVLHMRTHTGEKPFACDLCTYRSAIKCRLVRHMRTHTREKPYACELCQFKSSYKVSLDNHIRTHTGEKPFACELCEYKCIKKKTLLIHIRKHTGEKPFACELCSFKCATRCGLVSHMLIHSGKKRFECDVCGFKCAKKIGLQLHIRTHTGEKPYVCKLCPYKTSQSSALACHMKRHTGTKPYKCELCIYKCAHKGSLKRHMLIHTSKKSYVCKLCQQTFDSKRKFDNHIRSHYSNRPFACNLCSYKFSDNRTLVKHMNTHTGEKPFACELCDYKSNRKLCLAIHMRRHTGEKPYACEFCQFKCSHRESLAFHMKKHTADKSAA